MELTMCYCLLSVRGNCDDLKCFDQTFGENGERYSCNNLHPAPAGLDHNADYLWKKGNWDTPWDIHKCFVSKQAEKYEYVIIIPCDAPLGVVIAASERYPNLEFTLSYGSYIEEGQMTYDNGKLVHEK